MVLLHPHGKLVLSTILLLQCIVLNHLAHGSNLGQLTIDDIESMYIAEYSTEFSNMSPNKSKSLWKNESRRAWTSKQGQHKIVTGEITFVIPSPYIICDHTPDSSGNERKQIIHEMLLNRAKGNELNSIYTGDFISNPSNGPSCISTSLPRAVTNRVRKLDCGSNNSYCQIHPFLPMIKIYYNTVKTLTIFGEYGITTALFIVQLSPYASSPQTQIDMSSIIQDIQNRWRKTCYVDLKKALPYTQSQLNLDDGKCRYIDKVGESDFSIVSNDVDMVIFSVDAKSIENKDDLVDSFLYIITGLAARPEIIGVGIYMND
jgi:hypothetical protein